MLKEKSSLERAREARALKRMKVEYKRKHGRKFESEGGGSVRTEDSEEERRKNDPFLKMQDRVHRRVKKDKFRRKIYRLLAYQQELVN